MAHGENAEKRGHGGREYWSRRNPLRVHWALTWGAFGKWLTHRAERRLARAQERTARLLRQHPDPDAVQEDEP